MARLRFPARLAFVLFAAVSTAFCSKDPAAAKRQHLNSGNTYFSKGQYAQAIIEFRSAIKVDPNFGEARYGLAQAYEAAKNDASAAREYVRAADLLPDDDAVQLKAVLVLLRSGQFEDAKERVSKVVRRSPRNADAQILFANTLARLKDVKGAVAQAEQAIGLDPTRPEIYKALGQIQQVSGNPAEAERAFTRAIAIAPTSVDARLALANFYWASQRRAETEAALRDALRIDPANDSANRSLALLFIVTNRQAEAEAPLRIAARATPEAKIALASYYRRSTPPRFADAESALSEPAVAKLTAARLELARVRLAQRNTGEATTILDGVLKESPNHVAALVLKARLLAEQNKFDDALTAAKRAAAAEPEAAEAHFVLGLIYASRKDTENAKLSFEQVLKLNPSAAAAQVQLAQLHLASGHAETATNLATEALNNQPHSFEARVLLAKSLMVRRDLVQGQVQVDALAKQYPTSALVQDLVGRMALLKGNTSKAKAAFEEESRIDPLSPEALDGLLTVDLKDNRLDSARARVEAAVSKQPNNSRILLLAAATHLRLRDAARAEELLRSTIAVDAASFEAYAMLGDLYVSQQRLDQARAEYEALAKRQPKSVAAHTMIAAILETQHKTAAAKAKYEQIMEINPRAAVAANNLACIYAEGDGNLDAALQLAQVAKSEMPNHAAVNDTLGWIYYKKGLAAMAIPPLKQSTEAQPNNPLFSYHLGAAYAQIGDKRNARLQLERALRPGVAFPEAGDAKKLLDAQKG